MKIILGSDHAGYELKETLKIHLLSLGHDVEDKGAFGEHPDDDYPDFAYAVADVIKQGEDNVFGLVIGGSGNGEAIVANRSTKVRAAVFYGPKQAVYPIDISGKVSADPYEIVRLAREHNNANILTIGARFLSSDEAKKAVETFIETKFSGEERHSRRIAKYS